MYEAGEVIAANETVWIEKKGARRRMVTIGEVSRRPNGVVVHLEGVDDRTSAESLTGYEIFKAADDARLAAATADDPRSAVGSRVRGPDGKDVGTIRSVYTTPAHVLFGVWTGDREVLVPAVDAWVERIDRSKQEVVLRSIELFGTI
jgi:16S rRNA processing protein RimM